MSRASRRARDARCVESRADRGCAHSPTITSTSTVQTRSSRSTCSSRFQRWGSGPLATDSRAPKAEMSINDTASGSNTDTPEGTPRGYRRRSSVPTVDASDTSKSSKGRGSNRGSGTNVVRYRREADNRALASRGRATKASTSGGASTPRTGVVAGSTSQARAVSWRGTTARSRSAARLTTKRSSSGSGMRTSSLRESWRFMRAPWSDANRRSSLERCNAWPS